MAYRLCDSVRFLLFLHRGIWAPGAYCHTPFGVIRESQLWISRIRSVIKKFFDNLPFCLNLFRTFFADFHVRLTVKSDRF